MDKLSRKISQKTMQFLSSKGYKVLSEFALPNKKRVDIIAINSKKEMPTRNYSLLLVVALMALAASTVP